MEFATFLLAPLFAVWKGVNCFIKRDPAEKGISGILRRGDLGEEAVISLRLLKQSFGLAFTGRWGIHSPNV